MENINKIVVNKCYGEFGLSPRAIQWLFKNAESADLKKTIATALKRHKKDMEEACNSHNQEIINAVWKDIAFDVLALVSIPRHSPDLVKCVETLKEIASDEFAQLEVVTINGNTYRINEYDGMESVVTPDMEHYITI